MSELTTIIITIVSCGLGAGSWKFYEFLIRNKREKEKDDKSENNIFRDDLITRVAKLETDKEQCMSSLLELSTQLSSIKTKVEYLEKENERLNYK
jgi:uncharacterized protein YozE (UPF0346 family)